MNLHVGKPGHTSCSFRLTGLPPRALSPLQRCIWNIKPESAAQGEGSAQLSEPMACSRFRLVLYIKGR